MLVSTSKLSGLESVSPNIPLDGFIHRFDHLHITIHLDVSSNMSDVLFTSPHSHDRMCIVHLKISLCCVCAMCHIYLHPFKLTQASVK